MDIIAIGEIVITGLSLLAGVFGLLGRQKAKAKAAKLESITRAMVAGVEAYSKRATGLGAQVVSVKDVIQSTAYRVGVENELHNIVKSVTESLPSCVPKK